MNAENDVEKWKRLSTSHIKVIAFDVHGSHYLSYAHDGEQIAKANFRSICPEQKLWNVISDMSRNVLIFN